MSDPVLRLAKKRVKQKRGFFVHLSTFIATGFFFFALNMATMDPWDPELWFFFPLLPWSVGVIIHYLVTFGFPGNGALSAEWEEKQLKKEVQAIRKKMGTNRRENPYEEDRLDLPDLEPQESPDWRKEDYV